MIKLSSLGRMFGWGSANHYVGYWWVQRLTAVALVPLSAWFVISLLAMPLATYYTLTAWIHRGWNGAALIALSIFAAQHSYLGLRAIVEDYVHHPRVRTGTLLFLNFTHVLLAVAAVLAVSEVAFGVPK